MMRCFLVYALSLIPAIVCAQWSFKTVVSKKNLYRGESFQVQYVLEGSRKSVDLEPPVFKDFRLISGPNVYTGLSARPGGYEVTNFVFTLEAIKPGKFSVPQAIINLNGKKLKSGEVSILVSEKGGEESEYLLRPGENVWEKIKRNLFIRVEVDRRSCTVGQPILAKFKLYSRLESRSDIVKNPGFYGFTVYDIINLDHKVSGTETVNGRLFDVHTIRELQLYPLSAGKFIIDEMEVKNFVVFSKSDVNKRTEQEIIEGIVGKDFEKNDFKTKGEVYETTISTEPLTIAVQPLPTINQPAGYSGAVGKFSLTANLPDTILKTNQLGYLNLILTGQGNFTQLSPPELTWPATIEGLAPIVKSELDKTSIPLKGKTSFTYPFLAFSPGNYVLPPIEFSFFDPDTGKYSISKTQPVSFIVKPGVAVENPSFTNSSGKNRQGIIIIIILIALALLTGLLVYHIKIRSRENKILPVHTTKTGEVDFNNIHPSSGKFYDELNGLIWAWAGKELGLYGSRLNKSRLIGELKTRGIDDDLVEQLIDITRQTELGSYSRNSPVETGINLIEKTKEVLHKIQQSL